MKNFGKAFLLYFLLLAGKIYAQPNWSVNPGSFNYSMTITGVISLNYTEEQDVNNIVGAFVGGVCRGVSQPIYDALEDRYVVYLLVYSNTSGETVDFKVYDASADSIISIAKTVEFSNNKVEGSSEEPYFWSDPTLSSDSDILNFEISGQIGTTVIDSTSISIVMPAGTDLTALIATYTMSPYAVVTVDSIEQTSGVTANDFTASVTYKIVAADESSEKGYTVHVSIPNGVPSNISISADSISENTVSGNVVAILSTTDIDSDTSDFHIYTLVSGSGSTDNDYFTIEDSMLLLNTNLDYETKTTYNIRLKTQDKKGDSFEKEFTFFIVDENDEAPQWTGDSLLLLENMELRSIYTVLATDADFSPEFKILTYAITSGNSEGKFEIDANGTVSLVNPLDYETTSSYTLEITISDGVNSSIGQLIVDVNKETNFKAVNTFTPNNDGVNDYWEIENAYLYDECEFAIYNNIGEKVYTSTGYNNDWSGSSITGDVLPIGTYYYSVNCPNCKECNTVGFISIVH